jgi:hypothetical protein
MRQATMISRLLLSLAFTLLVQGESFDAAKDFSAFDNPNGFWSYGFKRSPIADFELFSEIIHRDGNMDFWTDPELGTDPTVAHNPLDTAESACPLCDYIAEPGQLWLHPGRNKELAVLRWTAPAAGTYSVQVSFTGLGGISTVTTLLFLNSVEIDRAPINGRGAKVLLKHVITVSKGDILDIAVDEGPDNFFNDTTAVDAVISPVVPLPTITSDPANLEVSPGATVHLQAHDQSGGALQYQWRFNGARIIGATSGDLTLTAITSADVGDYTVDVTDATGTRTSAPAKLTLFIDSDADGLTDSYEAGPKRYRFILGRITWAVAKASAEAQGGHLVTITSQAEQDLIVSMNITNNFWIGLQRTDQGWGWITGEPLDFTWWAPGQPSAGGEGDVAAAGHAPGGHLWNDVFLNQNDTAEGYLVEIGFFTDPHNRDTDGDGLSDKDEVDRYHTLPNSVDSDSDILTDKNEIELGTNPMVADTDGDGLSDGDEITIYHTDPLKKDTDGDGLLDAAELFTYHTNPLKADSDGDGFSDSTEIYAGKNPLDKNDNPAALLNIYQAIEIEFFTLAGQRYQVQTSDDLKTWTNLGDPIEGTGEIYHKLFSIRGGKKLFHRVERLL